MNESTQNALVWLSRIIILALRKFIDLMVGRVPDKLTDEVEDRRQNLHL